MSDFTPPSDRSQEQLDDLLRDVLPEIKLALGELIDRENTRSLPAKYAKILPDTVLAVTLRPDAAEALAPVARAVERDLTDSVMRHGSLYDRSYRVQLRRSEDEHAPLYRVSAHAGHGAEAPEPGPHEALPAVQAANDRTEFAPLPVADPDATRVAGEVGPPGWQPGRWVLVVRGVEGEEREAFRLTDPLTTVGRRSDDPQLRTTVALRDVPHVSRRQLALLWRERDGAPGFRVYNLGLNPLHLPGEELAGARVGRGPLDLDSVPDTSIGWLPPGVPLTIGEHGPVLEVEEVPPDEEDQVPEDPDATRYE
ncbi:MAG TPA: hypothetical protein VFL93_06470 [Longimicrobiaceae bacterium]|nr:hypothetical protein [Longimicrobiaceae bacterium]